MKSLGIHRATFKRPVIEIKRGCRFRQPLLLFGKRKLKHDTSAVANVVTCLACDPNRIVVDLDRPDLNPVLHLEIHFAAFLFCSLAMTLSALVRNLAISSLRRSP